SHELATAPSARPSSITLMTLITVSIVPVSYFFYLYGAHRDLHSFPTRRSSDLARVIENLLVRRPDCRRSLSDQFADARVIEKARSEEHTSELQSPCNLVCRLLLEKKK